MTKAMSMLLLHETNVDATVVQGHLALALHLEVYIYIYIYILNFANGILCMTNYL